jgi:hypothetical protein
VSLHNSHSAEEAGEGEAAGSNCCHPSSQETYLGIKTADFLRRTERMQFILTTTRKSGSGLMPFALEVCRYFHGDRRHGSNYPAR